MRVSVILGRWSAFYLLLAILAGAVPVHADLYAAAKAGDLAAVRAQLTAAPDTLNTWAPGQFAPLDAAVLHGHREVAEALLAAGAQLSATGDFVPPLQFAVWAGDVEMTTLLLDHGAVIDAPDGRGLTPLHLAAWRGNLPLVKLLLAHGANVETGDKRTWTALHFAAWSGQTEVVSLLVQHGPISTRIPWMAGRRSTWPPRRGTLNGESVARAESRYRHAGCSGADAAHVCARPASME